jgi:hypothetical protein
VRATIAKYRDTIQPGDMFFANDPHNGGGLHAQDVLIQLPVFAGDRMIAWVVNSGHMLDMGGRMIGLVLEELAVDGCITKAPGGGDCAGPSPVDRSKQGMKRSLLVEGYGIPLGRVLAPANRHAFPLLGPTLGKLSDIGPQPDDITVYLDAGYDSQKTRDELHRHGMTGDIAHKGGKAPHPSRPALAHRAHQRLQPPAELLRAQGRHHRRLLLPRRHHHHRT